VPYAKKFGVDLFLLLGVMVSELNERVLAGGEGMSRKKKTGKEVSIVRYSAVECLTFVAASGSGGVEAVYADESIWLTHKMMATLYDVDVRIINYHLNKIFSDSELQEDSVIRNFRITAADGKNYIYSSYVVNNNGLMEGFFAVHPVMAPSVSIPVCRYYFSLPGRMLSL